MLVVEYFRGAEKERIYVDKITNFVPRAGDKFVEPFSQVMYVVTGVPEFWPARQYVKVFVDNIE
jgi:hypothetical protein